jgi:hypothetical protein
MIFLAFPILQLQKGTFLLYLVSRMKVAMTFLLYLVFLMIVVMTFLLYRDYLAKIVVEAYLPYLGLIHSMVGYLRFQHFQNNFN